MTALQEQCIELLPVIQAGAEGKKIECFNGKKWVHKTEPGFLVTLSYRVAKPTRIFNGYTLPAPETVALPLGTWYFTPKLTGENFVMTAMWNHRTYDYRLLARGLVFLTENDAERNALAMLGKDPDNGVVGE